MRELHRIIKEYSQKSRLRLHMPGHKGNLVFVDSVFPYASDVSELDITDDLHRPEHALLRLKNRASKLWNANDSWLLTNGSTAGNFIAISAAEQMMKAGLSSNKKKIVLVERNSHRSIFNILNILELPYITLDIRKSDKNEDIFISPSYEMIRKFVEEYRGQIGLIILTMPNYEGIYSSELEKIICLAKDEGILLHIDAAHGAHLKFIDEDFDLGKLGVDLFTISLHKTLPAATSTAILFTSGDRIDSEIVDHFYDCYETSSPSYPLLLSIEDCLDFLDDLEDISTIKQNLKNIKESLKEKSYKILDNDDISEECKIDPLKIFIKNAGAKEILEGVGIYPEYSNYWGTLLILGIKSSKEIVDLFPDFISGSELLDEARVNCGCRIKEAAKENRNIIKGKRYRQYKYVGKNEAIGKTLARDLYFYPPGVPYRLAGEIFTKDDCLGLDDLISNGLNGTKNGKVAVEVDEVD